MFASGRAKKRRILLHVDCIPWQKRHTTVLLFTERLKHRWGQTPHRVTPVRRTDFFPSSPLFLNPVLPKRGHKSTTKAPSFLPSGGRSSPHCCLFGPTYTSVYNCIPLKATLGGTTQEWARLQDQMDGMCNFWEKRDWISDRILSQEKKKSKTGLTKGVCLQCYLYKFPWWSFLLPIHLHAHLPVSPIFPLKIELQFRSFRIFFFILMERIGFPPLFRHHRTLTLESCKNKLWSSFCSGHMWDPVSTTHTPPPPRPSSARGTF